MFSPAAHCSCSHQDTSQRGWQPHCIPCQLSHSAVNKLRKRQGLHHGHYQLPTGSSHQRRSKLAAVKDPDGPAGNSGDSFDIDQLAKQLSSEARRMRDTMSDEDLQQHAEGIAPSQEQSATTSYGPFGWEVRAHMLATVLATKILSASESSSTELVPADHQVRCSYCRNAWRWRLHS